MKKVLFFAVLFFAFASISLFAQQKDTKAQTLKPTFVVEDVYFAYQTLDNVEITGTEVEAFLEVRKFLEGQIKSIQGASKQPKDTYQIEITLPLAQNMMAFLGRAKLTGRMAEQYKRFSDTLVESAKALK